VFRGREPEKCETKRAIVLVIKRTVSFFLEELFDSGFRRLRITQVDLAVRRTRLADDLKRKLNAALPVKSSPQNFVTLLNLAQRGLETIRVKRSFDKDGGATELVLR
jgi:hypothetical protein